MGVDVRPGTIIQFNFCTLIAQIRDASRRKEKPEEGHAHAWDEGRMLGNSLLPALWGPEREGATSVS